MILHLIETGGPGGAEQMLLRLAEEYGRRGYSQMVCLRKDGWLAEEVRKRDLPLDIRPLGRLPDAGWLTGLRRKALSCGVKAIHAHEFAMNVRGALLARSLGVPSVATVHGRGYFGDKMSRRLAYRMTSRLTHLVAVSADIRHHLIERGGIAPERVYVIPNGVDTIRFQFCEQKRSAMRAHLSIRDDEFLLGTVGSYYPVKGHRFLIEAMRKLVQDYPRLKLVMAGQGPLANTLQAQAVEQGLGDHVRIVGYLEDTAAFLSALDLFVMPSLSEGQPLALLEAAANGRCIVASDVGGVPEIIENGKCGVLVPPGDTDALAKAIARVLREPDARGALAGAAAEQIKTYWSLERTVDRYLDLLFPSPHASSIAGSLESKVFG